MREPRSWRARVAAYITQQARPVDKFGHQPRLYELTRQVGAQSSYDDDVVYAAAWLHDLGVFVGHRPEDPEALARWNNTQYAIEQTPALLRRFDFPAEKIAVVLDVIRTHQPSGDPATIEATILRDADLLEQLGAVGILRAVAKVGRDTRYTTFTPVVAALEQVLAMLPGQIRLPTAKDLAAPRIKALESFIGSVKAEAGAHLH